MLKTIQVRALGNTVEAQFKELRSAPFILELVPLASSPIDLQFLRATQVAWYLAMRLKTYLRTFDAVTECKLGNYLEVIALLFLTNREFSEAVSRGKG